MLAQLAFNGIVTGLILALPALALTIVFGILKFPNFAIGASLTAGAYLAWSFNALLGLPMIAASLLAVAGLGCVMVAGDGLVYRHLRDRGPITLLVVSLGVSFVLENVCRFAFGNDARNFDIMVARPIRWHGLRINHEQLITGATVVATLLALYVLLRHTRIGRAMRAVADNAGLAAARGIERSRIVRITWFVAGAVTALAGVLIGLDRAIDPQLGWTYQINVFAAAILGGLGSVFGAVVGALLIGAVEELSSLALPTNYRQAVAFGAILLLLLVRPHGLFGQPVIRK